MWQDVDLKEKIARIRQQLTCTKSGPSFTQPKNNRGRNIALIDLAVQALRDHRKRQTDEKLKMGDLWQYTDLVLACSPKSDPVTMRV